MHVHISAIGALTWLAYGLIVVFLWRMVELFPGTPEWLREGMAFFF